MALTPERTQDLKDAFNFMSEKKETLAVGKVPNLLRALGYAPSLADEKKIAQFAGAAEVNFDGFLNILKNAESLLSGVNDLYESLMQFERTSASGAFTLKDLKYILTTQLGEPLSEEEYKQVVSALGLEKSEDTSPIRGQELVRALTSIKRF